jgi:GMP synthase (glutamine-hydrolysing)
MKDALAIINPGTQYTQQACKRLKERGFNSVVFDVSPRYNKDSDTWLYPSIDTEDLKDFPGYVILGSRHSVNGPVVPDVPDVFQFDKPVLGICYGTQHTAKHFGGTVANGRRQYGPAKTKVDLSCPIFANLEDIVQQVCMSHGDHVDELPDGFRSVASSKHLFDGTTFNDAIYNPKMKIFGLQFHPEVFLTTNGSQMLENFARICGLEPKFETEVKGIDYNKVIEERVKYLKDALEGNDARVIVPLSGGVDSTVAYALLKKAGIDESRIYAFHIDTGLNRLDESLQVIDTFDEMGWKVDLIDAKEIILNWKGKGNVPLREVTDDKLKRKLFQEAYQYILQQVIEKQGFNPKKDYVLQGTLETDKVESGRGKGSSGSAEIKLHHNVGGPLDVFRHLEPNAVFFKDQVREVARLLSLPESIVHRPPFPGPGNCVRIVGYDPQRKIGEDFSYVEERVMKTAQKFGFEAYVSPLIFVGTMGDERAEGYMAVVQNRDNVNWEKLFELSTQIPWYSVGDKGSCITRVVYALDKIDPTTVKSFTPTFADEEELYALRIAEVIFSRNTSHIKEISQNVVYMTPNNFGKEGARSIVLRPVHTPDFMTLRPVLPGKEIRIEGVEMIRNEMFQRFTYDSRLYGKLAAVLYDITYKPNGSTEPF